MKIRFLIANAYTIGGTVRTTVNTAAELARRGHDVEIVSVYRLRQTPRIDIPGNVTVRALVPRSRQDLEERDARWSLLTARERRLSAQPSRMIHPDDFRYARFDAWTDRKLAEFFRTTRDGVLVGTRAGLNLAIARHAHPAVVRVGQEHLHAGLYKGDLRKTIKREYPRLDLFSTLTSADAEVYQRLLGPEARMVVVPNAVPPMPPLRARWDAPVIVAAGRLTPQKAFGKLITAFRTVADAYPDWSLRIYGDGNRRADLQALIDRLGLGDRVSLMGFSTNLPHELVQGSIYAMSSLFEGFPMMLLEAMALGLPVVSFDLKNGPRDLITDGVDGRLVPDRDVDALAAALCELAGDPQRRAAMGAAAVEKVARYDLPSIVDRWEELFEELLRAKRAG